MPRKEFPVTTNTPADNAAHEPAVEPAPPVADQVETVEQSAADASAPTDESQHTAAAGEPKHDAVASAPEQAPADGAEPQAPASQDAPAAAEAAPAKTVSPAPASTPRPGPVPSPALIKPRPPVTPAAAPVAEASAGAEEWGTVADDGTVSVREGEGWRVVGQYPDGTPAEALAYFRRKYDDLELKARNLEQRHLAGGANAGELTGAARQLLGDVVGADAVGDLAGLAQRLESLAASLSEASAEQQQAQREAVAAAVAERTAIVEQVEALAARDPKTVQWKQTSTQLQELFEQWQKHQNDGPRLPRSTSQELWKRFRNARTGIERQRREFFAQLDETHKSARDSKSRLVERAEALLPRGEDGIPAYRALLDEWKASGRAGRKADDALWARFKAAGDALYAARTERDQAEQVESEPRIQARKELLVEAAAVADEADLRRARQLLTGIQRRWDEVGRIFPRERERALDDDMRKIEQALRAREDVDWKQNNPETQARATGMAQQLLDAIAKLETELADAEQRSDAKAAAAAREALDARKAWLQALGG